MPNQKAEQGSADPEVIDYLEEMLEQAKSGGVQSIAEYLSETSPTALDVFELPPWALLRANDIVGKKVGKKNKSRGARLIPVSQSTWWEGVRTGIYPPGKKVGSIRIWTVAEIRKLAEQLVATES